MVQKAEILIESYDNGVAIQWSDPNGDVACERLVAKTNEIEHVLGKEIWDDVFENMDKSGTLSVRIKLEYEVL